MKTLIEYIKEQKEDNKNSQWLSSVKKMYEWYCNNYKDFYDDYHFYSDENHKECELIDNKETIADCSGFVGACLCLAGYTDNALLWNVRLGSFNHFKNSNEDNLKEIDQKQKDKILYIADIQDFDCHRISEENKEKYDVSEIKAGDIIVKGSHVSIAADDGAKHLYDWGKDAKHNGTQPIDFYIPKDKHKTYPYRSYWRLK